MHVTYTIRNATDSFLEKLAAMDDRSRFDYLARQSRGDLRHMVSQKVGSGDAFRDRVELNQLKRDGYPSISYKLEPRRGYRLASFEIGK